MFLCSRHTVGASASASASVGVGAGAATAADDDDDYDYDDEYDDAPRCLSFCCILKSIFTVSISSMDVSNSPPLTVS